MIKAIPPVAWDMLASCIPAKRVPPQFGDKLHKIAQIIKGEDIDTVYRQLISQWLQPDKAMAQGREYRGLIWDDTIKQDRTDATGRMQLLDMLTYLPDDILTKVDRASMAASLEARVPLIDHRVVEFAWTLPRNFLVREGNGKAILRDVLYKYVPQEIVERPKMGFGVPIAKWLRHDLREWAEELISEERLKHEGHFNSSAIRQMWAEHLSGRRNWQYALWAVLMFQCWRQQEHTG